MIHSLLVQLKLLKMPSLRHREFTKGLVSLNYQPRSTGKERDAETGLDYFGARYYSGAQGRFTSPDWSPAPQAVPYADLSDPQTLNLYGYVRNNPLSRRDTDGHDDVAAAACIGSEKCLQDTANNRAAGVDKAVKFVSSPVGIGLIEL